MGDAPAEQADDREQVAALQELTLADEQRPVLGDVQDTEQCDEGEREEAEQREMPAVTQARDEGDRCDRDPAGEPLRGEVHPTRESHVEPPERPDSLLQPDLIGGEVRWWS